jgi:RNA polymerase sigma-70 factor (ECF subfamily)
MPMASQRLRSSASPVVMMSRGQVSTAPMVEDRSNDAPASDDELLVRAGTGDERAYRALVDRHLRRILALARRMTGNAAEAEDVAQEAFIRAWQKASGWRRGEAQFSTWLYRVVVNLCLDRRRRKPFAPIEAAGDPPDPAPGAELRLVEDERSRIVAEELRALPDRQRAALVLSYYEELSNAAAADVLGISISALESLLVRARRALRERLDRHESMQRD